MVINMNNKKTIRELANELNIERKKVKNKVDYLKRNGEISADIQSGVIYLSEADQITVCKSLNVPIFYANLADSQLPVNQLKEQVEDLKSDKEFLKKRIEEQERANSELRILLEKSIKQNEQPSLAENMSKKPQIENAETIYNKEINHFSAVAEKPTEKSYEEMTEEEKFWELNPNYKSYWNERLRPLREGKLDRQSFKVAKLRARRLKKTLEKIENKKFF